MTSGIANSGLVVGVDVGGTYTDFFFFDQASGATATVKVPSTPEDQAQGFVAGLKRQARDLGRIATIVHGTTVGTNALLQRKGGRTGVITTKGFRDVLEMRRRDRPETWGLWGAFVPAVPRDLRLEVDERTLADGTVRRPLDPAEVRAAAQRLLEAGAEAIAVIFINAYANDANERAAAAALAEIWPNGFINCSSDILPEIREFERASTTALNAALQPVVARYIGSLERRLAADGFGGQLLIVQSNGGVMSVATARRSPIRTALSGPAAGVIAGAAIAKAAGFANVITGDVGGTSFDVALIVGGRSAQAAETKIDFGLVVRTPMIEMTTIGAGGGSIAWVDRADLLRVGPHSAGADPGPACYGKGNDRPTVTDANLVLGRIDAERPIGGLGRLDRDAARAAIAQHVGVPLQLDELEAAEAIVRVANALMAGAIRLVSIERGHNPRAFALMAFGGGGALHAGALIADVGLAHALVPRFPGVTSALGCLIADMRHDFVRTVNQEVDATSPAALDREIVAMADQGNELLDRSQIAFVGRDIEIELDMSYVGQTHTVAVPLALTVANGTSGISQDAVRDSFELAYRNAFGRLLHDVPIRILNLRVATIGRRPAFDFSALGPAAGATLEQARRGSRRLWTAGHWQEAPVFSRLDLPVGAVIAGPSLLEQPDTTIYVDPGLSARIDALGNVIMERA